MQALTTLLLLWCLCPFQVLCQDENVVVQLPNLGHIKGRTVKTIGNQGHPQKTYYNFRNIPFAQSVSGPHRFSVSEHKYQTGHLGHQKIGKSVSDWVCWGCKMDFFFGTFGSLLPFYRFLKGFRRQDDKPDKYPIQHSIYRFLKTFLIRKEMNRKQDSS